MLLSRLNELDGEELAELERQVDSECVVQGGRQKPQLTDILAYQLLLLPIKLFQVAAASGQEKAFASHARWQCVVVPLHASEA